MGRVSPETKLVKKMRDAGDAKYGERLVLTKYHGSEYGEAGVSDLFGTLDGVFVTVEAKSPESSTHKRATLAASIEHALTKGPTLKQRLYVGRVLAAGGCSGFAATVPQFMAILEHTEAMADGTSPRPCRGHNLNGADE